MSFMELRELQWMDAEVATSLPTFAPFRGLEKQNYFAKQGLLDISSYHCT